MIFTGRNDSIQYINPNTLEVCIHSPTPNSIQMKNVKPTSISKHQPFDGDDSLNTLKDKQDKTTNVPSNVSTSIMIQINCQAANQSLMVNSEHHSSCGDNMAHSTITNRYRNTL